MLSSFRRINTLRKTRRNPFVDWNFATLEDRLAPAAFTAGNLVVLRTGDGIITYGSAGTGGMVSNTSAASFLDEYTTAGALVQSIPVPTTSSGGQFRLTNSINAGSEGALALSGNGSFVTFGGYDAAVSTPGVVATNSTANPRVIGRASFNGTVDTSTTTTAYSTGNIRGVATNDGNQFWTTGSIEGVRYYPAIGTVGAAGTSVSTLTNNRNVSVFGGRMYWSTGSGSTRGLYTATDPLPTSAVGQTDTSVTMNPAAATASPYAASFFDMDASGTITTGDRLYQADDAGTTGSLVRYTYNGTTFGTGTRIVGAVSNYRGLTGSVVNATTVTLFSTFSTATVGASSSFSTAIKTLIDDGTATATSTWSDLVAPVTFAGTANNASPIRSLRGITFVPTAPSGISTTSVVTSVSPLSTDILTPVTFMASVTAGTGMTTPDGIVQFRSGSTIFGTAPVTGSGAIGTASLTTTVTAGTFSSITAVFIPNAGFLTSTSVAFGSTLTVNAIATIATLATDNPNPTPGATLMLTATVAGASTPTGSVDFFANGVKLNSFAVALTGGTASFIAATALVQSLDGKTLTPGINDLSVVYNPTGIFLASTDDLAQRVQANAFTPGNIIIYRTGDGLNTLSANGNRFYIDEYAPGAGQTAPLQSVIMPTIASGLNKPVLASGVQSRDGQLALSPDGQFVYFPAYNAVPTNTSVLTFGTAAAIPRVVGRLNLVTGAIDTSMALTDVASGGAFRSVAVAADGSIYATGASSGVRYVPGYNAATTTSTGLGATGFSWTSVNVAGSPAQLYGSTQPTPSSPFSAPKIAKIGTGLPTTGTPTVTAFAGINPDVIVAPKYPTDIVLADLSGTVAADASGIDTMYVVEDGNFTGGTVTKWSWDATGLTWVQNGSISPPPGGVPGVSDSFSGLAGQITGTTVSLAITLGAGSSMQNGGGTLWTITDTAGYNTAFSSTTLTEVAQVGLGSLKNFRGTAIVPTAAPPATVTGFMVNGNPSAASQRSRLTTVQVNFSGLVDAAALQVPGAVTFTRTAVPSNNVETVGTIVNTSNGLIVSPATGLVNSVTLTFANIDNAGLDFASLSDGRWQLNIVPVSNYLSPNGPTDTQLRRFFGDTDNNGTVDGNDFGFFPPFGSAIANPFDFNNDLNIDGGDFGDFGNRFGYSL